MIAQIDLNVLATDVLAVLHAHKLTADGFTVELTVVGNAFDRITRNHSDQLPPGVLRRSHSSDGLQWSVVVRKSDDTALPSATPGPNQSAVSGDDVLNLNALINDVWALCQFSGLVATDIMIYLTIPGSEFDVLAAGHPHRIHPEVLQYSTSSGGVERFIQIMRRRALEEFPPGAILTPPT